jgi:hypothetical protein
LKAHALHAAGVEEGCRVIELAVLGPDGADQHAGAVVGRVLGDRLDRRAGGGGEGRLAHQVLGWIAGDEQLRQTIRSAPSAAARARALRSLSVLPARSPTIGLSWASGDFQRIGDCMRHGQTLGLAAGLAQREQIRAGAELGERGTRVSEWRYNRLGDDTGGCAILLWATLATLTVLTGPIPPFQTTAIAFAIGGSVVALAALARGRAHLMRPTLASLALGVYGLFGYHSLYFAALRLAPPAEAS